MLSDAISNFQRQKSWANHAYKCYLIKKTFRCQTIRRKTLKIVKKIQKYGKPIVEKIQTVDNQKVSLKQIKVVTSSFSCYNIISEVQSNDFSALFQVFWQKRLRNLKTKIKCFRSECCLNMLKEELFLCSCHWWEKRAHLHRWDRWSFS